MSQECAADHLVPAAPHDGALLVLLSDKWRLAQVQREHPEILLEPLIAG